MNERLWFNSSDIAFLFAPAAIHDELSRWLAASEIGHDKQSVTVPLLDPGWTDDQIVQAFVSHLEPTRRA